MKTKQNKQEENEQEKKLVRKKDSVNIDAGRNRKGNSSEKAAGKNEGRK